MKVWIVLAGLALSAALLPERAPAEPLLCLPPGAMVAKVRMERPSTEILASHDGSHARALFAAMSLLLFDDEETEELGADEITVLRSGGSDELVVLGSEAGCVIWRSEISRAQYDQAEWKAFGMPI
jgi:hypothetical protein